jgi:hypothetical protein
MNFTIVWIMDKLGFIPKEKDPNCKKVATKKKPTAKKSIGKRRLG